MEGGLEELLYVITFWGVIVFVLVVRIRSIQAWNTGGLHDIR